MKMELKEPKLWILNDGGSRSVYDLKEDAIADLKIAMKEEREVDLSIFDFEANTISSVPWMEIAVILAKGD